MQTPNSVSKPGLPRVCGLAKRGTPTSAPRGAAETFSAVDAAWSGANSKSTAEEFEIDWARFQIEGRGFHLPSTGWQRESPQPETEGDRQETRRREGR